MQTRELIGNHVGSVQAKLTSLMKILNKGLAAKRKSMPQTEDHGLSAADPMEELKQADIQEDLMKVTERTPLPLSEEPTALVIKHQQKNRKVEPLRQSDVIHEALSVMEDASEAQSDFHKKYAENRNTTANPSQITRNDYN